MTRYHYLHKFIFSILIIVAGCENVTTSIPSEELTTLTFTNGASQIYSISIEDENVGTNNVSITTGIQKTIDNNSYSFIIEYKETIEYGDETGVLNTYFKSYNNEYIYFSWETGPTEIKFLPLPLKYGEKLYGSFGIMNPNSLYITIMDYHETYTNKNNHSFTNVYEAQNESGSVRVFLNETYFIIQKEDYRYNSTIQSLILND